MGANGISYWLAEHPSIVQFRWSHAQSWGATWPFLLSAVFLHYLIHVLLGLLIRLSSRRRPVPLGPLPALHSLAMSLASAAIFLGTLLSSAAEVRDTRWLRRRSGTSPLQWLLCFPLGTRPSGRVFFWSYAFYLSRFLHLLRPLLSTLRDPAGGARPSRVFGYSTTVVTSFLWLEFSQSLQLLLILATTLAQVVVYGYYRFWVGFCMKDGGTCREGVARGQLLLLGCHVALHAGVVVLQFGRGGCSGIGAWIFNSLLNGVLMAVFLGFYAKRRRRRVVEVEGKKDD